MVVVVAPCACSPCASPSGSHHGASSCQASSKRRARSRFSGRSVSIVSPQATGWRASSSVSGKMLAHQVEVVDDDHDGAALAVPALDQRDQVDDGLGVHRVERLVEQDDLGVLHQHPREQRPLQLAARQRVDRPLLEPFEADRRQRLRDRSAVFVGEAAEQSALRPDAERNEVDDACREGTVEFGLLRQIGDARIARVHDVPVHRLQHPDDALHQGRFA